MIGQMLDHYRIESKLGEGGMGVITSYDSHLDRWWRSSSCLLTKSLIPARKQRFVHEARAASALKSPGYCDHP